jgi:hypothetical protein
MGAVEGASYTLVIVGGELLVYLLPFAVRLTVIACMWIACATAAHATELVAVGAERIGLAVAGAVLWAAANELLIQPKEYTCFNLALERIR